MNESYRDIAQDIIADRKEKLGVLHKEDVNEDVWKELCILLKDQDYAVDLAVNGEIVEWEFVEEDDFFSEGVGQIQARYSGNGANIPAGYDEEGNLA